MTRGDVLEELFRKLDREMDDYQDRMCSMTSNQVYARADEIAAMRFCYNQIVGHLYEWPEPDLEYLLRFKMPLAVVREQWTASQSDAHSESIEYTLWELRDKRDAERDYELDPDWSLRQNSFEGLNMF